MEDVGHFKTDDNPLEFTNILIDFIDEIEKCCLYWWCIFLLSILLN